LQPCHLRAAGHTSRKLRRRFTSPLPIGNGSVRDISFSKRIQEDKVQFVIVVMVAGQIQRRQPRFLIMHQMHLSRATSRPPPQGCTCPSPDQ